MKLNRYVVLISNTNINLRANLISTYSGLAALPRLIFRTKTYSNHICWSNRNIIISVCTNVLSKHLKA